MKTIQNCLYRSTIICTGVSLYPVKVVVGIVQRSTGQHSEVDVL